MKWKKRKCWMDRTDATLIKGLDSMHVMMPPMLRNRTDNEAFIQESIDTTALDAWLAKKNAENPEHRYTIFQAFVAALGRTIQQRPRMNWFIMGMRFYERLNISFSFVAKRTFSDKGAEGLAILTYDPESEKSSIDEMHDKICDFVYEFRTNDKQDATQNTTDIINKLPFFLVRFVMWFLHWLDRHGIMPKSLLAEDPYGSTIFITNLGSLHLKAGYHHLANWGTSSIFFTLGEKKLMPYYDEDGSITMRPTIEFGMTLDERIGDGYYFAKTIRFFKQLLLNPELLDTPVNVEVPFNE